MRTTLLFAVLLCLTGCASFGANVRSSVNWVEHQAHERVNRMGERHINDDTIQVEVAGPIGIDVESFAGSISVEVDDELSHALVNFTRIASHGFGRKEEAIASLEEISTGIELVPGELGQVLQVRTSTLHPEAHFQRVRVEILAPEVDGVRIRTTNGNVVLEDVYGNIDVHTNDGDVRLMTHYAMTRPVTIINDSGSIDYRVRNESTGAIDAEVVRGEVYHIAELGRWIIHRGTDHDTLNASFNDGVNPIVLRAADGDVRIAVVPGPTQVGHYILE